MEGTGRSDHDAIGQDKESVPKREIIPFYPASSSGERGASAAAAAGGASEGEGAVMPVADVMALLQAMREEQLDSLKKIADGVQQLQSQVMVLGESASASEGNTSLLLDRLASLEVRIGSIPVPMKPPNAASSRPQQHQHQPRQHTRQDVRPGFGAGGALGGRGDSTMQSQPSVARKVPPPPPAAVEDPGRVPTWQGRAEPEPPRPHFMRNASPQQKQPSVTSAKVVPTATSVKPVAPATGAGGIGGGAGNTGVSPEEAAKREAKRLAFMEDRARIQARISAAKGNAPAPGVAKPSETNANTPAPATGKSATVQSQPRAFETPSAGLSSPFAAPSGGGVFSTNPRAAGTEGVAEEKGPNGDEAAAWLEREKEQREKREKARREEEQRVERQRAEAKRLREEEEARKVREAEEAREREKARREAEAKRQAKTRILMSSLFDKDEDDGNSLFGGIGGAALPVFHDDNSNSNGNHGGSSPFGQAEKKRLAPASSIAEVVPPLSTGAGNDGGGSGGGLFSGIEEPAANRRGMFDEIDNPDPPGSEGDPSPMGGTLSTRMPDSVNDEGHPAGTIRPAVETTPPSAGLLSAGAGRNGGHKDGDAGVEPGGYSGLFDSSPPLEGPSSSSSRGKNNTADAGPKTKAATPADGATDEMDDFFSTLESAASSAPSGGAGSSGPTTSARASMFEDDLFGGPFGSSAGRAATEGNTGGTSLFDRPEFSIDPGDDDVGNVFGGGGGGVGSRDASTSFLSAMGDVGLLSGEDDGAVGRGGERGEADADREGMVEVSL